MSEDQRALADAFREHIAAFERAELAKANLRRVMHTYKLLRVAGGRHVVTLEDGYLDSPMTTAKVLLIPDEALS